MFTLFGIRNAYEFLNVKMLCEIRFRSSKHYESYEITVPFRFEFQIKIKMN